MSVIKDLYGLGLLGICLVVALYITTTYSINTQSSKEPTHIECTEWISYTIAGNMEYICYNENGDYSDIEQAIIKQYEYKKRQL